MNDVTCTYYIVLVDAKFFVQHAENCLQQLFCTMQKQRELLTSGVIFVVNRYKCFMENKNTIRTFCGCKPSEKKKKNPPFNLIEMLLVLLKTQRHWINSKIQIKVNKLWQKLFSQDKVKFINQVCLKGKELYNK